MRKTEFLLLGTALLICVGCSDDVVDPVDADPLADADVDAVAEMSDETVDPPDETVDDADADGDEPESPHVAFDLSEFTTGAPSDDDTVSVYEVTDPDELIGGVSAQGMLGDFLLENGHARYLVERADRAMSPCPYGGNIIDVDARTEGADEDVLGEVCLLINGGLTLVPETIEVIADGSDGGAGILAVTGGLHLNDFINLAGMAAGYLGGRIPELALDPEKIIPVTITIYYVLRPGDAGVHVITTIRNDGEEREFAGVFHIVRPGGDGGVFNPLSSTGGFGYASLGQDNLRAEPLPFLGFRSPRSSFAYVPDPNPQLQADLPIGGGYFGVAGTIVTLVGNDDMLGAILTAPSQLHRLRGIIDLEPGEVGYKSHWMFAGDASVSSVVDPAYAAIGAETEPVSGTVVDSDSNSIPGVLVTAIDDQGRAMNQTMTDESGDFAMQVPVGEYTLSARGHGYVTGSEVAADAGDASIEIVVLEGASLTITATTAGGDPTPARVAVRCDGECPYAPTTQEADIKNDRLPGGYARIDYIGVDGEVTLELEPGDYKIIVSRGVEWTYWPQDAATSGGHSISLAEGASESLEAEIAHVIDSSGAMSGDFHIHAISSTDSPVLNTRRVLNFMSEGVDVMVSTDHDFIVDYAPTIEALGAEDEITSLIGDEITTSDVGHINGFPLEVDETHRTGGAYDWGNGPELTHLLSEIYAWIDSFPGEQVIQINHPGGTVGSLKADLLLGTSAMEGEIIRMPEQPDTGIPGDTGYWSDDFTAFEVMNGHGNFWREFRWWLTMVGRGLLITATAVTDTHKLYGDLGGSPRSFVFVPDDADTHGEFDSAAFVRGVNSGALLVSNGPFFRTRLTNSSDEVAGLGEVVDAGDGTLTLEVEMDIPEWMSVDTIDLYINITEGIHTTNGGGISDRLPPTMTTSFELTEDDLSVAAEGDFEHRHYQKTVTLELDIDEDAYVVVLVRSANGPATLNPVIPNSNVRPLAFTNPIYVDGDGDGYDNPPLMAMRDELLEAGIEGKGEVSRDGSHGHESIDIRELTLEQIGEMIEGAQCDHGQ